MKIGAVCIRNVITVPAAAPLLEAARLLCASPGQGVVAIASPVNRPTALGVVTDRDIVRALLERDGHLDNLRVMDILPRSPVILSEDEEIHDAMAKLQAFNVQYAPVIGPGGTLSGAISQRQLLKQHQDAGCMNERR
jgi:CBS domain-containing protein